MHTWHYKEKWKFSPFKFVIFACFIYIWSLELSIFCIGFQCLIVKYVVFHTFFSPLCFSTVSLVIVCITAHSEVHNFVCHINGVSLYFCSSGGTGNSGGRSVRGIRRSFGADRDRDSPHESEHARNSPGQFHGDNAVMGPVVPIQQQKHRSRKLIFQYMKVTVCCGGLLHKR